jgi:hypothetical protein
MTDNSQIAGLLQALEHTAEMIDRCATVLERLIQAQQRGEAMDPVVVEAYAAQLRTVREQRVQLRQALAAWWQLLGREGAH